MSQTTMIATATVAAVATGVLGSSQPALLASHEQFPLPMPQPRQPPSRSGLRYFSSLSSLTMRLVCQRTPSTLTSRGATSPSSGEASAAASAARPAPRRRRPRRTPSPSAGSSGRPSPTLARRASPPTSRRRRRISSSRSPRARPWATTVSAFRYSGQLQVVSSRTDDALVSSLTSRRRRARVLQGPQGLPYPERPDQHLRQDGAQGKEIDPPSEMSNDKNDTENFSIARPRHPRRDDRLRPQPEDRPVRGRASYAAHCRPRLSNIYGRIFIIVQPAKPPASSHSALSCASRKRISIQSSTQLYRTG